MALQSSGAISLSQIQTELGGANPISLSEYYRNGTYTGGNNTSVPTSGAISMSNFYGASGLTTWNYNFTLVSDGKGSTNSALAISQTGGNLPPWLGGAALPSNRIFKVFFLEGKPGQTPNAFNVGQVQMWVATTSSPNTPLTGYLNENTFIPSCTISVRNNTKNAVAETWASAASTTDYYNANKGLYYFINNNKFANPTASWDCAVDAGDSMTLKIVGAL